MRCRDTVPRMLLVALTWMSFVLGLFAFEPYVKTEMAEKKDVTTLKRKIILNDAYIEYNYNVQKGKNEAFRQKSSDFVFGLNFGRASRSYGSWSPARFLRIFIRPTGTPQCGPIQLELQIPAKVVAYQNEDANYAEIIWKFHYKTEDVKVNLKLAQFASHKKWLFFRISCEKPCELVRYELFCYPGNAKWYKQRERILTHQGDSHNVSKADASFQPVSPGMIFRNLYQDEDDANLAVLDVSKIATVNAPKTPNGMLANIELKPDVKSASFALGYIANSENPSNDFRLFLEEKQDNIYAFLKSIDWSVAPSNQGFEKVIQTIDELLKSPLIHSKTEINNWKKRKNELVHRREELETTKNSVALIELTKQAENLKISIINQTIEQLK